MLFFVLNFHVFLAVGGSRGNGDQSVLKGVMELCAFSDRHTSQGGRGGGEEGGREEEGRCNS